MPNPSRHSPMPAPAVEPGNAGGHPGWARAINAGVHLAGVQASNARSHLTRMQIVQGATGASGGLLPQSVTYDSRGNITSKTGVGSYSYAAGSNRLASVTHDGATTSYTHDSNGNITGDGGRAVGYTSFDKPHTITRGGSTVRFAHDGGRARYKRVEGAEVTWYVGGVEVRALAGGGKRYTRYVEGHAIVTVTRTVTAADPVAGTEASVSRQEDVQYIATDHLGSIDAIMDANGALLHDLAFDAWGRRRSPDAPQTIIDNPRTALAALTALTPRGFTGHEMLDTVGLVHMNGRVYDPRLGRFLSADPFVQSPGNPQSHNRYSYAWNNPTNLTDPSGYFVLDKLAKRVVRGFVKVLGPELTNFIGGTVATIFGGSYGAAVWAYAFNRAMGLSYADSLRAGVIAGVAAAAFEGVAKTDWGWAERALANGAVGGTASVLRGGKFGHGFIAAGLGTSLSEGADARLVGAVGDFGKVLTHAVIGGTASELTGGKFANGAATAAFVAIMSEIAQPEETNEGGSPLSETATDSLQPADPDRQWVNPTGGQIRGCDVKGCGSYGANRGHGPHEGADFVATPGQDVVAVTNGVIDRIGYPYKENLSFRYIQIATSDGHTVRQFYTVPTNGISVGVSVSAGQIIGVHQGLGILYSGITEHVHIEIRHNGLLVDPAALIPAW